MLAVCDRKIAQRGPEVGVSFYAFFANTNGAPDLLPEAAHWIVAKQFNHFEMAVKIQAALGSNE